MTAISPLAGKLAPPEMLLDIASLMAAYYSEMPDPLNPAQSIQFGTSGHRGTSLDKSFNESHILAITQAICQYRQRRWIDGPLYLGIDTHALSQAAYTSVLEVLAANGIDVMVAGNGAFTPTPAVSLAILNYNRGKERGLADGIIITPSHNPPEYGGIKYNTPNGGPADTEVTQWIEQRANAYLQSSLSGVQRVPFETALRAKTTHCYDFMSAYVNELITVIDMESIRSAHLHIGVDPLGGAGVAYWPAIAERYKLDITVVNPSVDASFRFVPVDSDGKIRMDPSSPFAMQVLASRRNDFDIAVACDPDHDRHGIVTRSVGLMPPNHYLCVMIDYLFQHRPYWKKSAGIGKTIVSSDMIRRIAAELGQPVLDMPTGFKWFSPGLMQGTLSFAGEESAGASFSRRDGSVWTTDKDGITAALLAAEITAQTGHDPGFHYRNLSHRYGDPVETRLQVNATSAEKAKISRITSAQITSAELAGESILSILTRAPGNEAAISGVKVITEHGWFAARPSGTEDLYKIYAESFRGEEHLERILEDAQQIVDQALKSS
ncbi:phosphoglucomutase (alpha-D-glucose-1,6-bisphosphate-dependent) [Undibacterium sp. Rencai35W]|uniref:phosphoglucomutase (alpha-D-glucose-1,6-bisphosphate-dependent) n=1 Tax=Undibacterium sp. Rencai35W TaxID=3413046 RepID=UPI003BF40364